MFCRIQSLSIISLGAILSFALPAVDQVAAVQVTTPFVASNFESFEGIHDGLSGVGRTGSSGQLFYFQGPYDFGNGVRFVNPASPSAYVGDWSTNQTNSQDPTYSSLGHLNAYEVPDGTAWFGTDSGYFMEFQFDTPVSRVGVNPLVRDNNSIFRIEVYNSSGTLLEGHNFDGTPGAQFNISPGTWATHFNGIRRAQQDISRVVFRNFGGGQALDGLTFDDSLAVQVIADGSTNWDTASHWEYGLVPSSTDDAVVTAGNSILFLQGPNSPTTVNSLTLNGRDGATAYLRLKPSGSIATSTSHGVSLGKGGEIQGSGEIIGDLNGAEGSSITALFDANLALGNSLSYNGFRMEGEIRVYIDGTLQLNSRALALLGSNTYMFGGTLTAPNGVSLGAGRTIQGEGSVSARLAAQNGSTIAATGGLSLGDSNSPAGFYSDGELHTSDNTVTINDSNEAVLGSLTSLGDGTNGGTLVAGTAVSTDTAPHFLVEQGKNVIGRGNIVGNFKNNGHVVGDGDSSVSERIVFDSPWIVSGIGTFANTLVNGTFSPGLSPAVVEGENFAFAGKVQMELGGTTPGSGSQSHDQIIDLDTMELLSGVDLELKPWNGFEPQVGDTFELLRSNRNLLGTFDEVLIDPYFQSLGIGFDLEYSPNSLSVVAVSAGLAGDFDLDGDVDGRDFLAWQREPSVGNLADWQANYGGDGLLENIASVPEPTSGLLLVVATFTAFVRQRPVQV